MLFFKAFKKFANTCVPVVHLNLVDVLPAGYESRKLPLAAEISPYATTFNGLTSSIP